MVGLRERMGDESGYGSQPLMEAGTRVRLESNVEAGPSGGVRAGGKAVVEVHYLELVMECN
jgi:hypothetical protein